jgi:hypothetical protein
MSESTKRPTWTVITISPDSWPGDFEYDGSIDDTEVVARFPDGRGFWGSIEAFVWGSETCEDIMDGDRIGYLGGIWRYADEHDTPPISATQALADGLCKSAELAMAYAADVDNEAFADEWARHEEGLS